MIHRHRFSSLVLAIAAVPAAGYAADAAPVQPLETAWAYPVNPPLPKFDDKIKIKVPGSNLSFTQAQIEDDFGPPDWHPGDHPATPEVVAKGRKPTVMACMKCHLPNGLGHPESSDLAGLSVAYIQEQMEDFKNGNRKGARATSMFPIAKAVTAEEVRIAAEYFSKLKPMPDGWRKIVETDTVPKTFLGIGAMRFATEDGAKEPIGQRIIVLPQDPVRAEHRDDRSGFQSLVPKGSVAKGKTLVTTGGGKTVPCASCHGPDLRGNNNRPELKAFGEVPNIVGREPIYMFRQLNDFKLGTRGGPHSLLMKGVVASLTAEDMIAIAAYLTTAKL